MYEDLTLFEWCNVQAQPFPTAPNRDTLEDYSSTPGIILLFATMFSS